MLKFLNLLFNVGYEVTVIRLVCQFQSGLQVGEGLLALAGFGSDIASSGVDVSALRLQKDGLVIVGERPAVLTLFDPGLGLTGIGANKVGLQTQFLIIVSLASTIIHSLYIVSLP